MSYIIGPPGYSWFFAASFGLGVLASALYLKGELSIPVPAERREGNGS